MIYETKSTISVGQKLFDQEGNAVHMLICLYPFSKSCVFLFISGTVAFWWRLEAFPVADDHDCIMGRAQTSIVEHGNRTNPLHLSFTD